MNVPFLMRPSAKDYLWGGDRLNKEFGKGIDVYPLAETWECSTHPDGPSHAASGIHRGMSLAEILSAHPEYLGGREDGELPVLIKLIDAQKDLSVQVHPTDAYAMEHENGRCGKSEIWYVLDADEGASVVHGLKCGATADEIRAAAQDGMLERYLRRVPVKKGDVIDVKAGTIHAIGAGVLIAEIQMNSNLTYRLYDYNRTDKNGKKRPLHIDKALAVADLSGARSEKDVCSRDEKTPRKQLCAYPQFTVCRTAIYAPQGAVYDAAREMWHVLLCIEGSGSINAAGEVLKIGRGDCVFIPAGRAETTIGGRMCLLETSGIKV